MNNIKILYFDSISIDPQPLQTRLKNVCKSIYVVKDGLVIVNYEGTAQQLFDTLFSSDNRHNVFIHDLETSPDSYWGFMNRDLWQWIKQQK
mgnify:CR=1 FL=1